jgi:hypothetical protein
VPLIVLAVVWATRNFYERIMCGEKMTAGWASGSDFETSPIK